MRLGACCGRVLAAFLRPVQLAEDDPTRAHRKRVITGLCGTMAIVLLVMLALALASARIQPFYIAAISTGLAGSVVAYSSWVAAPRSRADLLYLVLMMASVMLADLNSINANRAWPLGVVVVDVALVLDVEQEFTAGLAAALLLHILSTGAIRTFTRLHQTLPIQEAWICECSEPPCVQPTPLLLSNMTATMVVVLVDLFLTRGFASGMRQQVRIVQNTIEVAEEIAEQLSLYEVEEGRALLESERGMRLPDGMKSALHRLLDNLDEYRPYLPDAALVREDGEHPSVEAPGLGREEADVTLCFTDVQSSTELWEEFPQGMYSALQQHCSTIRRAAGRCSGYEVKVIGDAFMLAFKRAADACRFGLDVQEALLDTKWPSDVLQHPLCKPTAAATANAAEDAVVWCGLRVRIGLHCGTVRVETNPVTGRCDYFGPPVNVAARVEASLQHGGLTGVTDAVLDAVTPAGLSQLGSPAAVELGARKLKGVGSPVSVTVLLSKRLAAREAVLSTPVGTTPDSDRNAADAPRLRLESALGSSLISSRRQSSRRPSVLTRSMRCSIASYVSSEGQAPPPVSRVSSGILRKRVVTSACFAVTLEGDPGGGLADVLGQQHHLGDSVREVLEAVEQAAVVTQGVLVGALSLRCFVVWNGPQVCHDHCGQGLRAADHVWRQVDGVATGLCSGEVLFGNVASGRKKHAMVIGGCVELAAALAEGAASSGEMGLTAGTFAQFCTTQQRTRRFAAWKVHGGEPLVLWALTAPHSNDDWREDDEHPPEPTFLQFIDLEARVPADGARGSTVCSDRQLSLGPGLGESAPELTS